MKTLVLVDLFQVFRLVITFAQDICHLGIEKEKDDNPLLLLITPICKLPLRVVRANAFEKSMNE